MAATINGVTFNDTVANTAGDRYVEGQPSIGQPQYEIENVASPGANGTIQKNFGFRGQPVSAQLAFIEASCPACIAAVNTFAGGLVPGRFSATFSGVAMTNMQGISCTPGVPEVILSPAGAVVAKVVASFSAIRRQ